MAEVEIQRGVSQLQTANVNVTVTSATKGLARVTSSCFSKSGRTAGSSSTKNADRDLAGTVRLSTSTNVLLKANSSAEAFDHDIHWEVWDFSGAAGTPNAAEVKMHSETLMNVGTSQLDVLIGSSLSVTAADCIAFLCGNGPAGASQNWSDSCYTVEIVTISTSVYARVKRGTSVARNGFTLAAIEFTGANWQVQNNISHTFSAAGSDETETITDVSDWTKAFVFGSHRGPSGNNGNDEVSITIRPGSGTTSLRFRMRSGASSPGSVVAIAHVVKNNALKVEHIDSITGSASDLPAGSSSPQTENVTITAVKDTAHTAVIAFTDCDETAAEYPRPHWAYRLTSTTNVEFWRGRHGTAGDFALQVIQFEWDQTVSAVTGVTSEEALGGPTVLRGPVTVIPTAIDTGEGYGTPVILRGPVSVFPTGIASDEVLGSPTILRGTVTVLPGGIATGEALGTPIITKIAYIAPTGIASAEAFGAIVIRRGPVVVIPGGIASAEAFGSIIVSIISVGEISKTFLVADRSIVYNVADRDFIFYNQSNFTFQVASGE